MRTISTESKKIVVGTSEDNRKRKNDACARHEENQMTRKTEQSMKKRSCFAWHGYREVADKLS
jgi:hypothetical protein